MVKCVANTYPCCVKADSQNASSEKCCFCQWVWLSKNIFAQNTIVKKLFWKQFHCTNNQTGRSYHAVGIPLWSFMAWHTTPTVRQLFDWTILVKAKTLAPIIPKLDDKLVSKIMQCELGFIMSKISKTKRLLKNWDASRIVWTTELNLKCHKIPTPSYHG